jgi:hypothetical protein
MDREAEMKVPHVIYVTAHFKIPKHLMDEARDAAKEQFTTPSAIIRLAVSEWLNARRLRKVVGK